MPVYIFKTNVINQSQVKGLKSNLNQLARKNERWNFDLEDCDKILRVETREPSAKKFAKALEIQGFHCEEL
ncbi:hypothetical protein [Galbibacter sp.]|uniref:hypothetical protein n=1 Tax=Galbibacter sp. TaxID=2918471 RepID=UPI003A93D8D4